jgi:hypothetical protein
MSIEMARFTYDSDTDAVRDALIEDELDDMSTELIEDIVTAYPAAFGFLARQYLAKHWGNASDVWEEAAERGWLDGED